MSDYLAFVDKLVSEGKTTGPNQGEDFIHYTEMSLQRMKRWNKVGKLLPEMEEAIQNISSKQHWVVLTEAWCGDAAHSFMFIQKMADANPNITLEWKLRDEHLELIDQYLTNGARAIPKLIVYNEEGTELWNWGPRPRHIQEKYWEMRNAKNPYHEIMMTVQKLYNEDKGRTLQKEILELMSTSN